MTAHRLEVADVFHAHQGQFLQRRGHVVSDQQRKALRDIGRCRTAALGTHLERCDRCNYETVAYDSCRNRHCPKCQSSARDRWLMKQAASLLPVPYAHVVFTVPEQLAPLALRNQRLFYNLLFRAASETLLEIAADPRHLGARLGYSLCCTPGRRTSDIIRTCTASFPPAEWPSIAPAGSQPGAASSCRCACSAACSAVRCSPSSTRAVDARNYASPARWLRSPNHAHFTPCSIRCAGESGWSTPSLRSADPNMS